MAKKPKPPKTTDELIHDELDRCTRRLHEIDPQCGLVLSCTAGNMTHSMIGGAPWAVFASLVQVSAKIYAQSEKGIMT